MHVSIERTIEFMRKARKFLIVGIDAIEFSVVIKKIKKLRFRVKLRTSLVDENIISFTYYNNDGPRFDYLFLKF